MYPQQPGQQPERPKKKPNRVLLIVLSSVFGVLLLCVAVTVIVGVTKDDKPAAPAAPVDVVTADQAGSAETMCHEFVKKQLKAPSTAKFPAAESVKKDGATYTVAAAVDSENSFGAMIRTPYVCVVHADGDDKWTLVDLNLQKV